MIPTVWNQNPTAVSPLQWFKSFFLIITLKMESVVQDFQSKELRRSSERN